jgi:hypothetical protein
MKMIEGRRYRCRNGSVTSELEENSANFMFPWRASVDGVFRTWDTDGRFHGPNLDSQFDLVELLNGTTIPAREKSILDMTLNDYRRGIANLGRVFA